MQEKIKDVVLKVISYIVLLSLYYPAVAVLRVLIFKSHEGISGFISLCLIVGTGFLAGALIIRDDEYSFIRDPIANCCVIIPMLTAAAVFWDNGLWRVLFEMAVVFVFYFIGLHGYTLKYGDVLSIGRLNIGVFLVTAALIAAGYIDIFMYMRGMFFGFAYTGMALTLLIKNQGNLERFIRRDIGSSGVPKNIRSINTMYILMVSLFILLLFNFKDLVLFLFDLTGKAIKLIFTFMAWMMGLFESDQIDNGGAVPPMQAFGFKDSENAVHPIISFIYNVMFFFIMFYSIYKLVPLIFTSVKKVLLKIYGWLKKFFTRLTTAYEKENEDYTDEIDAIRPSFNDRARNRSVKKIRSMRKDLKNIKDPVEKVRQLYSIIIYLLMSRNVDIRTYDTTGQIYRKAAAIPGISDPMSKITDIYEGVRYGDKIPEGGKLAQLEENYSKINESLGR